MESIPVINNANPQQPAPAYQNDASNVSARPIPVEVLVPPKGDSIILNGTEYNLKLVDAQQRQALINANRFLLTQTTAEPAANTTPNAAITTASQPAQLTALGTALTLKLPEAIAQLAQQNGISLERLFSLAGRPQGYPLPDVTITHKEFQFSNGTVIAQDAGTRLSAGEYQAKIALSQGRPILVLTPIVSKLEILIGASINETNVPIIDKQAANVVIAKAEPAQIYASFLRKLESLIPQPEMRSSNATTINISPSLSAQGTSVAASSMTPTLDATNLGQATTKANANNTQANAQTGQSITATRLPLGSLPPTTEQNITNTATNISLQNSSLIAATISQSAHVTNNLGQTKPDVQQIDSSSDGDINVNDVLQKAFNKAGALPSDQLVLRSNNNLATELLRHLPHINPQPLGQLSDPDSLKAEILGLATLNWAAQQLSHTSSFMNAGAITSLFQLLLGFRAKTTSALSQKLANYLEQLQARTGFSNNQLSQLSKAGGLESMGQLATSLHLYQQASGENNGNIVWFFALPYSINQRHEQLEGKFEQENDADEQQKHNGWHLQLKFNLAQGPLLISARYHQQLLEIQFKGNNQTLLNKVDNFLAPLSQKLSQLGFTTSELSTQIAPVPATLLPGDHFLVKTKA